MEQILSILEKKGRIASLVGFLISLPSNGWAVWCFFINLELSEGQLTTLFAINIIGWVWVVLPSRISAKFGNGEFIIED